MNDSECQTPLEIADSLLAHFSKVENTYAEYDRVCEQIPFYGPGSSRTPFIVAALIAALSSLLIIGCCIAGQFPAALYIFGLSQIPCFFLVGGGLLVYRKNRINYRKCCQKYLELSKQLQMHYVLYTNCPIAVKFTNPKILKAIRFQLEHGRAATIEAAKEQAISGFNRNCMDNQLSHLQTYTIHLTQPETVFLPGKYFSEKPGNFKDAAKFFLT